MSSGGHPLASWAEAQAYYAALRARARRTFAAEERACPLSPDVLCEAWLAGRLGSEGQTMHHGAVQVPDFGLPGAPGEPDVVHAELLVGGQRVVGSVVFHAEAEDWERCGCGTDARFDDVVLHVVAQEPPPGWFTRTSAEREVPVMPLRAELLQEVGAPPCRREGGLSRGVPGALADLPRESLETLLQAAAAHRAALKRERFRSRVSVVGEAQVWYEAWAQTLGYGANAATMQMLARRVPLAHLRAAGADEAVARLLGAAGFLVPVLPQRATEEERAYHRRVWDAWWRCRECYAARPLPWRMGAVRPMSHPHRRVAALACSAVLPGLWEQLADAAQWEFAEHRLAELRDDFWDVHCSLSAPALHRRCHLVGAATLQAFRVNHLLLYHEGSETWGQFLAQRADAVPGLLRRTACAWLGEARVRAGGDCADLLRRCYAQQGLLQLRADFEPGDFSPDVL